MKSAMIFAIAILASLPSFAQSRGRIDLGGGRTTVRVEVGADRTDLNQNERIRRLEEAVRDLQIQVFDLRDQPQQRIVRVNVCSVATNFDGIFIGKGTTRLEAEAEAVSKCRARSSFCNQTAKCEVVDEVVNVR